MSFNALMAAQLRKVRDQWSKATVIVEHRTGLNGYGEPTYGTPVTFTDARLEGRVRQYRSATESERTSQEAVYLKSSADWTPEDRVTLPDGSVRLVQQVEVLTVGEDVVETVLYLGAQIAV